MKGTINGIQIYCCQLLTQFHAVINYDHQFKIERFKFKILFYKIK
jgi:hypothetical protein